MKIGQKTSLKQLAFLVLSEDIVKEAVGGILCSRGMWVRNLTRDEV